MTDLRQAAQQALEALGSGNPYHQQLAAKVLRTALEQQAEPVAYFDFQEAKFSWAKHMKIGPVPVSIKVEPMKLYLEAPQQQAEPPPEWLLIKNILAVFGLNAISFVAKWQAAQQQAEPLTDEQLDEIAVVARRGNLHDLRIAIEAKLKEKNND